MVNNKLDEGARNGKSFGHYHQKKKSLVHIPEKKRKTKRKSLVGYFPKTCIREG